MASEADREFRPVTITRRAAAIAAAHRAQDHPNPCGSGAVAAVLSRIRRTHGTGRRHEAAPLDLGPLGLILNTIVLYNTIYTQRALDHLKATGGEIADADIERLSPLGTDHITLTGRYRIALPSAYTTRAPTDPSPLRPTPEPHDQGGGHARLSRFSHELSIAPGPDCRGAAGDGSYSRGSPPFTWWPLSLRRSDGPGASANWLRPAPGSSAHRKI